LLFSLSERDKPFESATLYPRCEVTVTVRATVFVDWHRVVRQTFIGQLCIVANIRVYCSVTMYYSLSDFLRVSVNPAWKCSLQ